MGPGKVTPVSTLSGLILFLSHLDPVRLDSIHNEWALMGLCPNIQVLEYSAKKFGIPDVAPVRFRKGVHGVYIPGG